MKKIIIVFICSWFIISCNGCVEQKQLKKITEILDSSFILKGTLINFSTSKVFLNKIIENTLYPIDSSTITNNTFIFKGTVEYPERFALTFKNYAANVVLIIENTDFQITINQLQINTPVITQSPLNLKLKKYQLASKNIFKKINYLFPRFQKARLENNVKKLTEINEEMKKIENEFIDFSYNFIKSNKNSYVSAMVLRDQLNLSKVDTLRIKNAYKSFSEKLKMSPDSKIIAAFLNL